MKNFLFLCSICISFLSIGQVQEQNPNNTIESQNPKKETQKVSKISRINKRVDATRTKKVPVEGVKIDKQ